MANSRRGNSTNVRFMPTLVRVMERVAPEWLEDKAFALWCRPQKTVGAWGGAAAGARTFLQDAGDVSLAAWEWNPGGARGTALLVHGWSGNAAQMGSFVEPLVARGFHVVAIDLPAHGASPGNFATIFSLAHTLASVGRRLLPKVIIAHSLGGTATSYALTLGLAPEKVVLLASPVQLPPYLRHFGDQFGLSVGMQDRLLTRVEKVIGRPVSELDLRAHAGKFGEVRAMVVHDRGDVVVPVGSSEELTALWPGARLVVTEGLSHDRVRRDRAVVSEVVNFVQPLSEERVGAPVLAVA